MSTPRSPYRRLILGVWATVLVAIALLAGLLAWHVRSEEARDRQHLADSTHAIAAVNASLLDEMLNGQDRFLRVLRAHLLAGTDGPGIERLLREEHRVQTAVMDFLVLDAEGHIRHWTGAGDPPDVRQRPYYTAHLDASVDRPHLTPALASLIHPGRHFFALSRPVLSEAGALHGVVVALIAIDRLAERFARVHRHPDSTVVMGEASGTTLFRLPAVPGAIGTRLPGFVEHFRKPSPGFILAESPFDGRLRLVATQHLEHFPLMAAASFDLGELLDAHQRRIVTAVTLLCLMAAGLIALATLIHRRLARQAAAESALAASETRLRTIIESEPECIKLVDAEGRLRQMNPAGLAMIEAGSFAEVAGRPVLELIAEEYRAAYAALHRRVIAGESAQLEYPVVGLKGGRRWLETHAVPMRQGDTVLHLAITRDISARKTAEEAQKLAASVFESSYDGILITDADNRIVDVNPAFTRITGYSRAEVIGQSPGLLKSGRQGPDFYARMWRDLLGGDHWRGEVWNRRKSGEVYAELLSISVLRDEAGEPRHFIGVFTDISRLKEHEAELDRIAHYDTLTGVPNRRLLADRLDQALARAQRSGRALAVCYLDLDGFKPVNDRHGHAAGDALLIEITQRLRATLRAEDTLARLGGDEFVLLLSDLSSPEECHTALDRVLAAVSAPVKVGEASAQVSASIGVTLYPRDDSDADTLLRHADQAMYLAKSGGKNRYHFFDLDEDRQIQARRQDLARLAEALEKGEFELFYQPKIDLLDGRVFGVEALLRWRHPDQGLLSPAAFLPVLAGSDLEIALGDWVLEQVLCQIVHWRGLGVDLIVSANIGAEHLLRGDFVERLREALARHPEVPPAQLELEILESAALADMDQAAHVLNTCIGLGVRFALDDFGTGYSSLAYFRSLPVEMLKIDQSFVRDMLDDPNDLGIVESVVKLAQAFNRPVIAEGVESLEHGALLLNLGCRLGQGYGIARPMPAAELPDWLQRWGDRALWLELDSRFESREDIALMVAGQSHRRWIEQVERQIEAGFDPSRATPDLQHCRFGRWYHGSGTVRYGSLPEFRAIDPLHVRIHAQAEEMLAQAAAGDPESARAGLPGLHALRDQLLAHLDALIARVRAS